MLADTAARDRAEATEPSVAFCRTVITEDAQRAAVGVLASGWVTTGPETLAFEEEFAAWVGAKDVVAVSSCTAAIQMALAALGLPPGAPVLTPTLTFCGAVHAIVNAGLRPALVDVDEATLTVSPEGVAAAARSGAAAMVVQHMAGYPIDPRPLAEAAGLSLDVVIEAAASATGQSEVLLEPGASASTQPRTCRSARVARSPAATRSSPPGCGACDFTG
jgi:perosamine synthetase